MESMTMFKPITTFNPLLAALLPQTHRLLQTAHLVLHPAVERLVLSGSRGIGGRPRPDSDLDLSLIVAGNALPATEPEREQVLRAVLQTTLSTWQGAVDCDLAAIYDERVCGLSCLAGQHTLPPACTNGEQCRFGVYKVQKGFAGFIPWAIIELGRMYPVLEIWRR
ncbi:MAG: hypothetical protein HC822_20255 [Oscillochloris sp.]|nr:hypothetical protein [Oscillochloris sp.]